MTFNTDVVFITSKSYDPDTGNMTGGKEIKINGVEVHELKDDAISAQYGANRTIVRVKTSRGVKIPTNASLKWQGQTFTPLDKTSFNSFLGFNHRHWNSRRFISVGGRND